MTQNDAFSVVNPLPFPLSPAPKSQRRPNNAQKLLRGSIPLSQGGIFSPFRANFAFPPQYSACSAPAGCEAAGFWVFCGGALFFLRNLGLFLRTFSVFWGLLWAGKSSIFSPPCPRMFLPILNPTRRHLEGADFLAKKMTSASCFFLPF